MPTYNLLIASADEVLFDKEVTAAIFPGTDGIFEVLANHAPLIALIKKGSVRITDASGHKHTIDVSGGFLEFQKNKGVLLVN